MVGIRLTGRLGNQMFQYAFAYVKAKQLGTVVFVDQYLEKTLLFKYFNIRKTCLDYAMLPAFDIKGFKNLFSLWLRRWFYKTIETIIFKHTYVQINFEKIPQSPKIVNQTLINGFFQSHKYFIEHDIDIRKIFAFNQSYLEKLNSRFNFLYKQHYEFVAVHIRRTDYKDLSYIDLGNSDLRLPISYYEQIINKLNNDNRYFIFLSDEIAFAKTHFGYIKNALFSSDIDLVDFYHLQKASIVVISNSSFSWWGAYLNNIQNKVVLAPRYYLGFHLKKEIPEFIYPSDWITLDVNNPEVNLVP